MNHNSSDDEGKLSDTEDNTKDSLPLTCVINIQTESASQAKVGLS